MIENSLAGCALCTNCEKPLNGSYCPECGQKKFSRKDFTVKKFAQEFADDVFDFDSKIFKTLKLLLLQPGRLTLEYLQGKQKKYVSPVKLYLIIITLNFLVYSFFDNYSPIEVNYLSSIEDSWITPLIHQDLRNSGLDREAYFHQLNGQVNETFSLCLYFLIFIFALVLKLFFYRSGRYYIEHLIFCLHFMSFGFLRDTLCLPLYMYYKDLAVILGISTTLIYFYFAIEPVYGNTGIKRWFTAILLYGLFFSLFACAIIFSVLINIVEF